MPSSNRKGADAPSTAGELIDGPDKQDCSKHPGGWGRPMADYEYIWFGNKGEDDYPEEACLPYYHLSAQIDNLQVNTEINGNGEVNVGGEVKSNSGGHVLSNKKNLPFDLPHPNKEGWRLRHVCIEGPEIAVYCRGKVSKDGIINLPEYWENFVNVEDMSISLTPIGSWQELFVKEVLWGKQVIVRNNAGGPINADYYIVARRLDDDLVVEYEGKTHEDYPGGNEGYSFNFEHNYVKGLIKKFVKENFDTGS
jgi:hypothetical protein